MWTSAYFQAILRNNLELTEVGEELGICVGVLPPRRKQSKRFKDEVSRNWKIGNKVLAYR